MNKPPAFQFYAQDFLTGTMYLTNEEIGIYIKLLAKQWTDNKIPKKRLGLLIGCDWEKLSDELKSKFIDKGDFVINARLELERDKKERFLEKQKENGKKGGRPPKNKEPKLNPTKSQKNPLEDEDEIEEEIEVIKYRFDSKKFKSNWDRWKQYKKSAHKFNYFDDLSEQKAIRELENLSSNEDQAVSIINQSIDKGWKGLFKIEEFKEKSSAKKEITFDTNR